MLHASITGYVYGNRFGETMRVATKAITASIMETSSSFAPEHAKSGIVDFKLKLHVKRSLASFLKVTVFEKLQSVNYKKKAVASFIQNASL